MIVMAIMMMIITVMVCYDAYVGNYNGNDNNYNEYWK